MSENNWQRRWHPLLREWVIIAAKTQARPWSGSSAAATELESPVHDPNCYLCPGVTRASGEKNPDYKKPFAFTNDFATFAMDAPSPVSNSSFEKVDSALGTCRVLCFSPEHNKTFAKLGNSEIKSIIDLWIEEFEELSKNPEIKNILIFENKGQEIGVSNPHPHGQIYATGFVPKIPQTQLDSFNHYHQENESCLLCDLLKNEKEKNERIVFENESFIIFVPFFARFPYEVYLVPKRHISTIVELEDFEKDDLTEALKVMTAKYDNLFQRSFPNITALQNAPTNMDSKNFHFHIEFYPPLRDQDKLKYLAGFESGGGNIINPILPKEAAKLLREASNTHYLD